VSHDLRAVLTAAQRDLIAASDTLRADAQVALTQAAEAYRNELVTAGVATAPAVYRDVYARMASAVEVTEDTRQTDNLIRWAVVVRVPWNGATVVGADGKPVPIGKVSGGYEFGSLGGNLVRDTGPTGFSRIVKRDYAQLVKSPRLRKQFAIGLRQFPPHSRDGWWIIPTFVRMQPALEADFIAAMNKAIERVESGGVAA
jgi:hypothetical protein